MSRTRFSSERIESLRADEIFVFGSNRQGWHGGGAAAYARQRFGAVWGEGIGRTGQCYAIPTMDGSVEKVRPYVEEFIAYAEAHPEYTVTQIAPFFSAALDLPNVLLPQRFVEYLQQANE